MKRSGVVFFCQLLWAMGSASGLWAKERTPAATGEYEILLGGKRIGQEQFALYRGKELAVEATSSIYWPEPTRYEYRFELGPSYQPKKLQMSVTRSGLVTELELKPSGNQWRCEIKGRARKKTRQELGRREGTEVDFRSPLFNTFIIWRLGLDPGGEKTVHAIVLQLPDLGGIRARQTYRRLEDEEIQTKVGGAAVVQAYELIAGESTHRIWYDDDGIALRARFDTPPAPLEYELVRFQSTPGAWRPPSSAAAAFCQPAGNRTGQP